jgi:hypothetical protein
MTTAPRCFWSSYCDEPGMTSSVQWMPVWPPPTWPTDCRLEIADCRLNSQIYILQSTISGGPPSDQCSDFQCDQLLNHGGGTRPKLEMKISWFGHNRGIGGISLR